MTRYGPQRQPVGWVYLAEGYTIRWECGDHVAYVFAGKQMKTYPDGPPRVPVHATVPVPPSGWTDLAHIRLVGERWLRSSGTKPRRPSSGELAAQLRRLLSHGDPTDEEIVRVVSRSVT
ncbi:MAG: hypothetical protein ACRDRZ_02950 [Pseudonocardiaceae bacterium]